MEEFSRFIKLIGNDKFNILKDKKVVIIGIGGVGGYAFEALVRGGISNITIVDYDIIDITNLNRQVITNINNIGRYKVDVAKERALEINRNLNVTVIKEKLNEENVIDIIKDNDYIEATIYAAGMMYRAEASDKEILAAIDKIVDVIERQIRKNKTRLSKKIKRDATLDANLISGATYTEGEETKEFEVVKTKRFTVKPMSVEEAILQMNLLGHTFFVFKNQETDEMNVVYKRKDGKYAVIESIE